MRPILEEVESNYTSSSARPDLANRYCNFTAAEAGVVSERTLGGRQREGRKRGRSWSVREWWDQDAERRRTGMVYMQETRERTDESRERSER
jgi:hypothetical protein